MWMLMLIWVRMLAHDGLLHPTCLSLETGDRYATHTFVHRMVNRPNEIVASFVRTVQKNKLHNYPALFKSNKIIIFITTD